MRTYSDEQLKIERIYYSGTDTLQEGYALCFKNDADAADADRKLRLGVQAVKPATANLALFAGVVAPSSAGKTGPAWVDVIRPEKGKIVRASVKANATALVTKLGPANASYALAAVPIDLTSAATADASGSKQAALATATADTSGGEAIKYVKWV